MERDTFSPNALQRTSLISAGVGIVLGIAYTILTLSLPYAAIGRPNAPKAFPLALGILMTLLSAALLVQQVMKVRADSAIKHPSQEKKKGIFPLEHHTKQIIITVINGVFYGLLFSRIGYVLSTFIFLGGELLLFNGKRKWRTVLIVSLIFSLFIYILFNKLLGVYLPRMPIIGF